MGYYKNQQVEQQDELVAHIKELNAKSDAWVAEGKGRWASHLSEDPSYWETQGVTTPAQLDKLLENDY